MTRNKRLSGAQVFLWTTFGVGTGLVAGFALSEWVGGVKYTIKDGIVFDRQVGAALRLEHPNLCKAHRAGIEDGVPFLALELVKDRRTKEPFDAGLKLSERIRVRAMENGLIVYPMGGVVDGKVFAALGFWTDHLRRLLGLLAVECRRLIGAIGHQKCLPP